MRAKEAGRARSIAVIILAVLVAMVFSFSPIFTDNANAKKHKRLRNITRVKITTKAKLTEGKTYKLKSKAYVGKKKASKKNARKYKYRKWSVSNKKIATIKGKKLKTKKPGTFTLKVKTAGGATAKKKITVKKQDLMKVDADKLSTATVNKLHVQAINKERKKAGVKPVVMDEELDQIAAMRAKGFYKQNGLSWSHFVKGYGCPDDTILRYYKNAKELFDLSPGTNSVENAGVIGTSNGNNSVSTFIGMVKDSPLHKSNMLDVNHDKIGVGRYKDYWVQMFVNYLNDDSDVIEVIDVTNAEPDENGNITIE